MIMLETDRRDVGTDVDLLVTSALVARLGGGPGGAAVLYRPATRWDRVRHGSGRWLGIVAMIVTWAGTVAAALLAYLESRHDNAGVSALLALAAVVLFLAALGASLELIRSLRSARSPG
jgi:hypothetical protein